MVSHPTTSTPPELKSAIARNPLVVSASTTVADAIAQMNSVQSSCVLIVEEGKLLGILTEQDVVHLNAQQQPLDRLLVQQVMTDPIVTLRESAWTDFLFAINLLQEHHAHPVPILDEQDHLVGLLDPNTLSQFLNQNSQTRWEYALEGAGDGIWDWHIQVNQVFFSRQWKAILGYEEHEIGNAVEEWENRIHPEDNAKCHNTLNKYFKGEKPTYQVEHRVRCKDGNYKWILARGKVIEWTAGGEPLRMIGTHSDISDRKQAERQLHNLIEGTAATTGEDFFPALVSHMAEVVNVSYALVTELVGEQLNVLAFWADGTLKPTFSYPPAQTPCEQALRDGKFYCESLVQQQFPADLDLVEMGAESYLGIALRDTNGRAIGNLCILDKQPIQKIYRAENLLRVFAARAAAELERKRVIQELEQLNQELENKVKERTAALQKSEERWQLGLKGANDGIWDWDLSNNTIFFSDRWKEMRGFTRDEIRDTPDEYLSCIHPNDYARVIITVNEHFAGRTEFFEVEYRVRHKNGSYMWVLDRAQAQRDDSGQIIRMIGTNSNISTRKQAEAQLQEQKQFLRSINDGVDCPIFVIDVLDHNTFAYIYWNAAAEKASGIPVCEIVGKSPEDIYGISAGGRERQRLQQCLDTEMSLSYEEPLEFPGQAESWWLTTLNPQKDSSGKIYRIVGTTFDISDRKQTEFQLAISRQKYYSLIQSVNGIVWEYDLYNHRFVFVSNKAEELLGYPIKDWLGEPHFWKNHVYAEDVGEAEKRFDEAIQNRKSCELEYRMVAADGSLVWVYDISSFNHDDKGNPITSSGILIDIRDRKRLEEAQNQLLTTLECTNAELIRATRLKDEFLANMSHELRTPLNVILGMSECLQEELLGTLNARQKKSIATIERSGSHLLELINDILDVAKIEAGQIELSYTSTSIHTLCQSSLAFIKQQAFQKRIQLNIQLQPNLPELFVDERRIRQVLINLLNNAVKFTAEDGKITLEVSQISPNLDHSNPLSQNFLRISVIDTGIGIAPENIKKLFQPFIQIDSALNRQYTGTGLGLALVRRIVELHGGKVGLTSELGVGSCFMIEIPYHYAAKNLESALNGLEDSIELNTESSLYKPITPYADNHQAGPFDEPLAPAQTFELSQ